MPDFSIGRILREPLFHFFMLGLGIFALYSWTNPNGRNGDGGARIVIGTQDVDRLAQQFEATWRRRPTQSELQALIEAQVQEEILIREAKALGLDQGDPIIRNRLAQKMTFLTASVAQSMLPDEAVLAAHMQDNRDRFTLPGMLAFDQIGLPDGADADAALAALSAGTDPEEIGIRSLLPSDMPLTTERGIDAIFGRDFYATLTPLPENVWSGPVQSGYGAHLVRLTDRKDPVLPPLDEIRDQVLADWRRERTDALTAAQLDAFRESYEIETPSPEALSQWAAK